MAKVFNDAAIRRISAAVRKVERLQPTSEFRSSRRNATPMVSSLYVAKEDIEHGEIGKAQLLKSAALDTSGKDVATWAEEVDVYNPIHRVWQGTELVCDMIGLPGADSGNEYLLFIDHAWSATRISGTATSVITPGGSGTITNVNGLNGLYPYNSAQVFLPSGGTAVQSGSFVTAQLNHSYAQAPNSFFVADAQQSSSNPNPVSGEIAWQMFNATSFYRSDQPGSPASNTYLYLLGENVTAYPLLNRTSPTDDHDLFEVMGSSFVASAVGQLRCRATGWYSFSLRLIYRQRVDTAAPVIPDPPKSYYAEARIGVGSQIDTLIQNREITNEETNSLTSSGFKYALSCEFFREVQQDDRLAIDSAVRRVDGTTIGQDMSTWGYQPDKLELFIKRLG